MKFVVFGLSISSSWGNGHATLWRGLASALASSGHSLVFFERDTEHYAQNRDEKEPPGCELVLYKGWDDVYPTVKRHLADADVAMVTSFCPDAQRASEHVIASRAAVRAFYDLDTPVTLGKLHAGEPVPYVPAGGLAEFDIVFSFTGGRALDELRDRLRARHVRALYASVDVSTHRPTAPLERYRADLSYLGTYSADRQAALDALFLEPARMLPNKRFVLGGALYPQEFPWADNTWFVRHVPPPEHPAFYCSSRLTLNVTRGAMAKVGYCPSGRLFEAAACGTAMLSDAFVGLDTFFEPGREILVAKSTEDVVAALERPQAELKAIAMRARNRVLAEHTAQHRARELIDAVRMAPMRKSRS
jgi:spore maturation protein CgeB